MAKLNWLWGITCLCVCLPAQSISQPKHRSLPTWISAKWAPDLPEYRQIRQQLEVLKFGPKRDLPKVRSLLAQHAGPLMDSLRSMGVTKRKVAVKEIFWAVALEAYFPKESARFKLHTGYVLASCPIEPTYEFARVAYCVYTEDSRDGPQVSLGKRLLAKDPKDQLVQTVFIEMASFTDRYYPAVHDVAVEYAESLARTLTYRQDLVKWLFLKAYESHCLASMKKSSYKRFMDYVTKLANDKSMLQDDRDILKRRIAYYRSIEKKVAWRGE